MYNIFILEYGYMLWVFNAICNNIAIISWRSFLLVEDIGVLGEKY
jgi:hypothetical protein